MITVNKQLHRPPAPADEQTAVGINEADRENGAGMLDGSDSSAQSDSRANRLLERLRGVVLLGGTVRASALRSAIKRPVLALPVQAGRTVLGCWREQCISLAEAVELWRLPVRLLLDRDSPEPQHDWPADRQVLLATERDAMEYRGTGGILKELADGYDANDYLLVANAAQLLQAPLPALARSLAGTGADVAVIAHADGTPSGLTLFRCGCAREIASIGFVDLKEQALPVIAKRHRVVVVERSRPSALPIRTLADYIEALRRYHGEASGNDAQDFGYVEDWRPVFAVVEDPQDVHRNARIHNSVVLRGGRVEDGAVVVGSVVCPGAVVRHGRLVADELVTAARGR